MRIVLLHLPTYEEEDNADADVCEHNTHPNFHAERIHKCEDSRPLLDGFFDHDGDPNWHEGLGEVGYLLSLGVDSKWSDSNLGLPPHQLAHHPCGLQFRYYPAVREATSNRQNKIISSDSLPILSHNVLITIQNECQLVTIFYSSYHSSLPRNSGLATHISYPAQAWWGTECPLVWLLHRPDLCSSPHTFHFLAAQAPRAASFSASCTALPVWWSW